jgi:hypothetical protein
MRTVVQGYINLPEKEQERIFAYIGNLPIQKEVTINGRTFILVHAVPVLYEGRTDIRLDAFDIRNRKQRDLIESFVWDRQYYHKIPGKIVVTGHNLNPGTFGHSFIESDGKYDNDTEDYEVDLNLMGNFGKSKCLEPFSWACIDTGLACQDSEISKLGILCLDDLSFEVRKNLDEKDRNPLL